MQNNWKFCKFETSFQIKPILNLSFTMQNIPKTWKKSYEAKKKNLIFKIVFTKVWKYQAYFIPSLLNFFDVAYF
jgi:hypothetical protein